MGSETFSISWGKGFSEYTDADIQRARKLAKKSKLSFDEEAELRQIYAAAAREPVGTGALERIADGNTCSKCSHDGERHPAHKGKCLVYVPFATDGWYCPCGREKQSTATTSSKKEQPISTTASKKEQPISIVAHKSIVSTVGTGKHSDYVIWSLRHEACKKCHGESKTLPCICGIQPCFNCGVAQASLQTHYDHGCNHCVTEKDKPRVIEVENLPYYILVSCPHCKIENLVSGHDSGHHPAAQVLQCYVCDKKSWLGQDTPHDYEDFINHKSTSHEIGTRLSNG